MVHLLALVLSNTLQSRKFCVVQVRVLLSFLAQLKDFARRKSWSRLDFLGFGSCTVPLPYIGADDFSVTKVDVWNKHIPAFR